MRFVTINIELFHQISESESYCVGKIFLHSSIATVLSEMAVFTGHFQGGVVCLFLFLIQAFRNYFWKVIEYHNK